MITNFTRVILLVSILLIVSATNPLTVFADDKNQASNAPIKADKSIESLDQALADIAHKRETISGLKKMIAKSDGLIKSAYEHRLDKTSLILMQQGVSFAEEVVADKDVVGLDKYRVQAIEVLSSQGDIANTVIRRIRDRVEIPKPELSAAEQAAAYSRIFDMQGSINLAYDLLVQSIELSQQFNTDVAAKEASLKKNLDDRAADGSIFLEMLLQEIIPLRASVEVAPDDAELKAKMLLAEKNIDSSAVVLDAVLSMMDSLEMDTSDYQELVLGATGEVTSDIFEVSVITKLFLGWGGKLWSVVIEDGPDLIFKLFLFCIIIYLSRKLSNVVHRVADEGLKRSQLQLSELLRRMLLSILRNIIVVLGFLIALSQIGFTLGPLLAGLGVVGFVIGFALQETLSNFASGLMILTYRPYDVGDLIEAAGVFGTVSHMSLVNTTIMTLDNQTIIIPNNKIWGDVIKNVTAQKTRRVDLLFGISYNDDIPKAERVLQDIIDSHEKVFTTPAPMVRLHELGDSSVNFIVRPWVAMEDYWDVYWDITRSVKLRFDEEEISIPFPQRDIHFHKT